MKRRFAISKKTNSSTVNYLIRLSIFLLLILSSHPAELLAQDIISRKNIDVVIDAAKGVRVFYKDRLILPEVGTFSLYKMGLSGREQVTSGPWRNGTVGKKISDDSYKAQGADAISGVKYAVGLHLTQSSALRIDVSIEMPAVIPGGIEFRIGNLSPDIFKGGIMQTDDPSQLSLPLVPTPFDKRILFTDKKTLNIASYVTDITIHPLGDDKISLADFRLVPWDRTRSFYVFTNHRFVYTERTITFSYEISLLPASLKASTQFSSRMRAETPPSHTLKVEEKEFYSIPPKIGTHRPGSLILGHTIPLYGNATNQLVQLLEKEFSNIAGRDIKLKRNRNNISQVVGVRVIINSNAIDNLHDEGFELKITKEGVALACTDERGCIYGIFTLAQKASSQDGDIRLPYFVEKDWPDIPVRGVLTELLPPGKKNVDYFKGYINAIVKARGNTLIIYHNPLHVKHLMTGKTTDQEWNKKELTEIIGYARALKMTVIPGLSSKFTSKDFPEIVLAEDSNFYNPFNEGSYTMLFSLYRTLLDLYKPDSLFIGHDEIQNIGRGAPTGWSNAKVLAYDVNKINDWLKQRGVKTIMSGDMLLDRNVWSKETDNANSNNPFLGAQNTHDALEYIAKNVIILDWHYRPSDDYPTIKYFKDRGFTVNGMSWYDPHNSISMAQSVKNYGAKGVFASDWGLWPAMMPAAVSLYTLKAAWNNSIQIQEDGEDAVRALADEMYESAFPQHTKGFKTVSILQAVNETTWDDVFGDGRGFFDLGGGLDLRLMPEGEQSFGHVLFNILPSNKGKIKNCIVVSRRMQTNTSETILSLGRLRAEKLAFLHTLYVKEPQVWMRKVGSYTILYESGRKVVIDLLENYNIVDFRVSSNGIRDNPWLIISGQDILLGSTLGWRGPTLSDSLVNLQVMIWDNNYPQEQIREIRVQAADDAQIALLGLSAKAIH